VQSHSPKTGSPSGSNIDDGGSSVNTLLERDDDRQQKSQFTLVRTRLPFVSD
jgi:hypothetical protein